MKKAKIQKIVKEIIEQIRAISIKDMGNVMKLTKERCGVVADGGTINQIAKEMLT